MPSGAKINVLICSITRAFQISAAPLRSDMPIIELFMPQILITLQLCIKNLCLSTKNSKVPYTEMKRISSQVLRLVVWS